MASGDRSGMPLPPVHIPVLAGSGRGLSGVATRCRGYAAAVDPGCFGAASMICWPLCVPWVPALPSE